MCCTLLSVERCSLGNTSLHRDEMTPPLQEYSSVLYYTKLYYTKHFVDHSNIWAKFILTNEQIPIIQIFCSKVWEYTTLCGIIHKLPLSWYLWKYFNWSVRPLSNMESRNKLHYIEIHHHVCINSMIMESARKVIPFSSSPYPEGTGWDIES